MSQYGSFLHINKEAIDMRVMIALSKFENNFWKIRRVFSEIVDLELSSEAACVTLLNGKGEGIKAWVLYQGRFINVTINAQCPWVKYRRLLSINFSFEENDLKACVGRWVCNGQFAAGYSCGIINLDRNKTPAA